jgi:hypothetical protein
VGFGVRRRRQRRFRDSRASLRRGRGEDARLFSPALIEVAGAAQSVVGNGLGVGEERYEREWRLAGREQLINASRESSPLESSPEPQEVGSVHGLVWVLEIPISAVLGYGKVPHNPRFHTGLSRISALDRPDSLSVGSGWSCVAALLARVGLVGLRSSSSSSAVSGCSAASGTQPSARIPDGVLRKTSASRGFLAFWWGVLRLQNREWVRIRVRIISSP